MDRNALLGSALLVLGLAVGAAAWVLFGTRAPGAAGPPLPPLLGVPAFYVEDATLLRLVTSDTVSAVVVVAPGVQTLGTTFHLTTREDARWISHGFAFTTADSVRADMPLKRDTLVIEHREDGYAVGTQRFEAGAGALVYWDWHAGWGAAEPLPSVEALPLSSGGRAELARALGLPRRALSALFVEPPR